MDSLTGNVAPKSGKRSSAVEFVSVWQQSNSRREVAEALEVSYGSIVSREKTMRKAGVQLKEMPKQQRGIKIDADALNLLISQIDE
jgi:transposase